MNVNVIDVSPLPHSITGSIPAEIESEGQKIVPNPWMTKWVGGVTKKTLLARVAGKNMTHWARKLIQDPLFKVLQRRRFDEFVVLTPRELGLTEEQQPRLLDLLGEELLLAWSRKHLANGYFITTCAPETGLHILGECKGLSKDETLWIVTEPIVDSEGQALGLSIYCEKLDGQQWLSTGSVALGRRCPLDLPLLYRLCSHKRMKIVKSE